MLTDKTHYVLNKPTGQSKFLNSDILKVALTLKFSMYDRC